MVEATYNANHSKVIYSGNENVHDTAPRIQITKRAWIKCMKRYHIQPA